MKYGSLSALVAGALLVAAANPAWAQEEWSFEGNELLVTNMVGEVTVRGHDGSRIIVRAQRGGDDADVISFEVKQGGRAEFHAVYPLDQATEYHYPRRRGGSTQFRLEGWANESSFLEDLYSAISPRERIRIGGDVGRGALEAWADLEVLVPRGVETHVVIAVGEIKAMDVDAAVDLDTHSGAVSAENIGGDTRIDTGSGSVDVNGVRGNLSVDTGSGSVEAANIEGDRILIDTGSGRVTVNDAAASSLEVDTGSGSVRTSNIACENSKIDTGSGSVTLDLVQMGTGSYVIDTGSGGVTVNLPADASVHIIAETGSGGINLDVPNAMLRRMSRDEVELEIGGGDARLEIDTGSGGITIRSR
ncbi:MAG: DUF4097 family beta strand repeat protein [Gemmatimonadota bacterium]|nr:MAG: DUF4097 family beta strand repeat protein [Gemmatimonadota bacterium]